jgi:pyochelin biosynthetic protein PchC
MTTMATTGLWLRRYHPAPDGAPTVVAFPHAGGAASSFVPLSATLSPDVEVLAVQYPGRQDRRLEPCAPSIAELADRVTDELAPWRGGRLVLFGHSMGAIVAYEVALRLARVGVPPAAVVASASKPPSRFAIDFGDIDDDAVLVDRLRTLSGTENGVLDDDELVRAILPAVRGDYRALRKYRHEPGERLSCPVGVFTGLDDPMVGVRDATGWADHTTGGIRVRGFPGGHFYLDARRDAVAAALIELVSGTGDT